MGSGLYCTVVTTCWLATCTAQLVWSCEVVGTSAAGLPTAGGAAPRLAAANASVDAVEGARGRAEPRDSRGRERAGETRARAPN